MATPYEEAYEAAKKELERIDEALKNKEKSDKPGLNPYDMNISPSYLEMVQKATLHAFYDKYIKKPEEPNEDTPGEPNEDTPEEPNQDTPITTFLDLCIEKIDHSSDKENLLNILDITSKQYQHAENRTKRRILLKRITILIVAVVIAFLAATYYGNKEIIKENDRFSEEIKPLQDIYNELKKTPKSILYQQQHFRENQNHESSCSSCTINKTIRTHNGKIREIQISRDQLRFFSVLPATTLLMQDTWYLLAGSSVVDKCAGNNKYLKDAIAKRRLK
jgi:hypothetical protein